MSQSSRCPNCGFAYAWDGVRCNHCNPDRRYWDIADEGAFLERMYAEPENEFLPLVYSDWLDDQGDIRGTLLRLEVERSKLAPTFDEVDINVIDENIDSLLDRAGFPIKHWFDELKRLRNRGAKVMNCGLTKDEVEENLRFNLTCRMVWPMLLDHGEPMSRQCRRCNKAIHYCITEQHATDLIRAGQSIALSAELDVQIRQRYKPAGTVLEIADPSPLKLWKRFIFDGDEPHLVFENEEGVTLEGVLIHHDGGGVTFELRPNPILPTITSLPADLSARWLRQFHLWRL